MGNGCAIVYIGEHCWLNEESGVKISWTAASNSDAGASVLAWGNLGFHALTLPGSSHRSDLSVRGGRNTNLQTASESGECVDDFRVPGLWSKDSGSQETGLPIVEQGRGELGFH
ncbi:hypothetical protein KaCgl_09600 [Corynebacterium glutamicum]|nr:hypothetical protein KaCgl_09600 [Corynebacterium glutamicum]